MGLFDLVFSFGHYLEAAAWVVLLEPVMSAPAAVDRGFLYPVWAASLLRGLFWWQGGADMQLHATRKRLMWHWGTVMYFTQLVPALVVFIAVVSHEFIVPWRQKAEKKE